MVADRAESRAGHHGRKSQAASNMTEVRIGRTEQISGNPGSRQDIPHQNEQRHHRKLIGEDRLGDGHRDHRQGRIEPQLQTDSRNRNDK
jgi:hypothetical protein